MVTFLLIVQTLVAAALVGVILMQRSEGGGLGVGGSSAGLMTARGAADFLTRATAVLGAAFIILSILMVVIYRFVPRKATTGRHAAVGAILATVLWELAKGAFAYYIRSIAQYSGVYGTLEGIIVLALWLEISVSIVLYCGEVVAMQEALRAVEWRGGRSGDECPLCDGLNPAAVNPPGGAGTGHTPDCAVGKALGVSPQA
jgi:YihY family inner membrane protein